MREKIKETVFPLYFSIIVNEGFNLTKLKLYGYPSMHHFFTGKLKTKMNDHFDWRGVNNSTVKSKNKQAVNMVVPWTFINIKILFLI